MSHQIEVGRAIGGDSGPSTDLGKRTVAHRSWLILAIALIVTATLLAWGIWSRIGAGKALHGDPSASYQSPASSDSRWLAIIGPKDRAHVPHAKA